MNYRWRWGSIIPQSWGGAWAVRAIRRLMKSCPVRVLVENMSPSHHNCHPYLIDPAFISQIVREADCYFLLDLAHAQIAAELRSESTRDYVNQLPLDRLVEIHVSGPRQQNGRLEDAHQWLQETDYELLDWTLNQARPQAVTLEYWYEKEPLKTQLLRLQAIMENGA
jgi:uncharacterized protein (UPF0276 family)